MPKPPDRHSLVASRRIDERAQRVLWKGGPEATRHELLQACGFPRYLESADGARVRDVDGNVYLDYLMSWGTVFLGHNAPQVAREVQRQLERGALFNLGVEQEVSLAERLQAHIPGAERVRFVASGSEATNAAVRIARAVTGREKIVQYGFHGWLDWCQSAHPAGIARDTLRSALTLEYNNLDALTGQFSEHRDEIACVIMEPFKDEAPNQGYLQAVREMAHRHGALFIFDEIKTGFRFGPGGAQAHFGVTPDLCVFSKAMANGYPLAALAGRADIFEQAPEVWVSGTYHGWPPAIAAAHATLSALENAPLAQQVWTLGERLMSGFNSIMRRHALPARLAGLPPMPQVRYPAGVNARMQQLFSRLVVRGYFIHPIRPWFISVAHSLEDIEQTLADIEAVLGEAADT